MPRLALLICLIATPCWATTWYVRPVTGEYGAEDGTSYETAFDGLGTTTNGASSASALANYEPGDVIVLCGGPQGFKEAKFSNADAASGSEGNPITITGDCSEYEEPASTWTAPDGGTIKGTIVDGTGQGDTERGFDILDSSDWVLTNVEVRNWQTSGVNWRTTSNSETTARRIKVVDSWIHDIVHETLPDQRGNCVNAFGSHIEVENSIIERCSGDGIHIEGENARVVGNVVRDPSYPGDHDSGDCVHIGNATADSAADAYIAGNTLYHNYVWKQPIVVQAANTESGGIIESNTIYAPKRDIAISGAGSITVFQIGGVTVRWNKIYSPAGIFFSSQSSTGGGIAYGNLVVNTNDDNLEWGCIGNNGSNNYTFKNNTCYNYKTGITSFGATSVVSSNIVQRTIGTGISAGSASTNEARNICHRCGNAFPNGAGIGSIEDDPLFVDAKGGDFRLAPGSPAWRAGGGDCHPDVRGRSRPAPCSIGAYEPTSGDPVMTTREPSVQHTSAGAREPITHPRSPRE